MSGPSKPKESSFTPLTQPNSKAGADKGDEVANDVSAGGTTKVIHEKDPSLSRLPGPRMGPRPPDFDEEMVRNAPTFLKWEKLAPGKKMKYACREFTKGFGEDEERLMRRIMIARRNNLKDHEVLKKARAANAVEEPKINEGGKSGSERKGRVTTNPSGTRKRRFAEELPMDDIDLMYEMDHPAVESTRSFRKWLSLNDGEEFVYTQVFVKGMPGHDWILKKNIWRRMRYRRENQKMIEEMKSSQAKTNDSTDFEKRKKLDQVIGGHPRQTVTGCEENSLVSVAAMETAAAAAQSLVQDNELSINAEAVAALEVSSINNPLLKGSLDEAQGISDDVNNNSGGEDEAGIDLAVTSALEAAARLAASVVLPAGRDDADSNGEYIEV